MENRIFIKYENNRLAENSLRIWRMAIYYKRGACILTQVCRWFFIFLWHFFHKFSIHKQAQTQNDLDCVFVRPIHVQ